MKIFDMEDTFHFKVDWFNWFKNVLDTRSKKKITIIHLFNLFKEGKSENLKDRCKGQLYLENEDFRYGEYFSLKSNWFKNLLDPRSKKKITIIHSFRTETWKKRVKFLPMYTLIHSIAFSILERSFNN